MFSLQNDCFVLSIIIRAARIKTRGGKIVRQIEGGFDRGRQDFAKGGRVRQTMPSIVPNITEVET